MSHILLMHGGAPTAVINASLYGAVREAQESGFDGRILAARGGTGGFLRESFIDLSSRPDSDIEALKYSPGSAIGSGRDHLESEDYDRMIELCRKHDISRVLLTGGNGTMDTCRKLSRAAKGSGVTVTGIPKTMDNDLSVTDHSPGFGSAARYLAGSVREVAYDVKGLPIHVVVIETFGRDAGWLTASGVFASTGRGSAPDMVLLPEVAFDEEKFLKRAEELFRAKGGVVVLASEGLKGRDGKPIVEPIFSVGRSIYFGDVSAHLANLIIRKLGIKARSEKPGILGRCSEKWVSLSDREEAVACGRVSMRAALNGLNGYMSIIKREDCPEYRVSFDAVPIRDEILKERTVPLEWIDSDAFSMKQEFINYAAPLVGGGLGEFVSFT